MALSTNQVAGLASGFDWRSMVDQLIALEYRRVTLVENKKSDYSSKLEVLQGINTKLLSFRTKAETLASSDAFYVFTSSLTTDSSTYSASDFLSVTTSSDAGPGSHTVEMETTSRLAQARKMSSKSFSDYDTALNTLDSSFVGGEFVINGRAVSVEADDDLTDIRDKINNLNTGSNATNVTASILTVSTTDYRLVLTSENTGEDAFSILDASADTVNILQGSSTGLGFSDATTPAIKNTTSDGAESDRFSSSEVAVGSLLGISSAQTGTNLTVGTTSTLDIDLATESLTTIAANIDALSGVSASVESITEDGVTQYYIDISGTTTFGDDNNVLQTLGILKGNQSSVAEVHLSDTANTAVSTGLAVTGSITFDDITGYTPSTSDTITISGTKHDGTTVTATDFDIYSGSYKDFDALLDEIETQFGLTADSAVLVDGKIQVTDSTAGDSQLSIALVANNEGGGTLDLGTLTASTQGYEMQIQAGQDARVKIDGTTVTSESNSIDDIIEGVTLNLLTMESGKKVDITVDRDLNTIKSTVQSLLDSYNDILADLNDQFAYDEESETAGILQGDATLRSIKSNLQSIVVSTITGLPTTLNALSLIGIGTTVDLENPRNDGKLTIDNDDFMDALEDNFNGVRRIFVAEGTTTDGDVEYVSHTRDTVAGDYDVNITQAATQATVLGNEALDDTLAANETLTITDTVTGAAAEISLDSGDTLTEIVNSINSELSAEYTESHVSDTANVDLSGGDPITNVATWSEIDTTGGSNDIVDGDTITVTGTRRNGTSVSDSYTIDDADVDTIQGFLSFIETLYENEASAYIDTSGKLVLLDNTAGDSALSISVTENNEGGGSLDFGTLSTSAGVDGRDALDITASASGNYLQIAHNQYGSASGFTISQNVRGTEYNEIVTTATANTTSASDGKAYIVGSTQWDEIDGFTADTADTLTIWGTDTDGTSINAAKTPNYSLYSGGYNDIDDLLSSIESTFGNVDARIEQGKIVVEDLDGGDGSLDVYLEYNGSGGLTLGDGSDNLEVAKSRDQDLGLVNGAHGGLNVEGTINNESATGTGQVLTGDAPGTGETTSVEDLSIRYTGTGTGDQGDVEITMGVSELFDRILYDITNVADGYLDYRLESIADRVTDLDENIKEMVARLDRKTETLINRFVIMELTLAQIQNQTDWLAGQIKASYSAWD